jgi:hypothetical protein
MVNVKDFSFWAVATLVIFVVCASIGSLLVTYAVSGDFTLAFGVFLSTVGVSNAIASKWIGEE